MSDQLSLFNRFTTLRVAEALPIYWELEGIFLPGRAHRSEIKRIQESALSKLWLHEVTAYDLRDYLRDRKSENPDLKGSSLNKERTKIVRIFSAFYEWRRLGQPKGYDFSNLQLPVENPGVNTDVCPRYDESIYRRDVVVVAEDFSKWCDYAHPSVRKIATVAILTLLRRKDIKLLDKSKFDRALDQVSGIQSKTGKPFKIPASLTLKIIFGAAETEVICDFTNYRRRWTRACLEAGVFFRISDLRHTGATQLLLEGVDLRTIQMLLGHQSLNMTMVYLNPPAKASKAAVKKLEAYVKKAPGVELEFCEN